MNDFQRSVWHLPDEFIVYNCVFLAMCLFGILSNVTLQIQFLRNWKSITVSSFSLVHISICDMLMLISVAAACTSFELSHPRELSWFFCQFNGFTVVILIASSGLSFTLISIERYFQIILGRSTTKKQLAIMLLTTWGIAGTIACIPFITKTYYVPQPAKFYCLGNIGGSEFGNRLYGMASLFTVVAACVVITVSYYSIYKRAVADGFKWNHETFVSAKSRLHNFISEKSNPDSSAHFVGGSGIIRTISSVKAVPKVTKKTDAYKTQMQMTLKLAFLTFYFYITWLGTCASWGYQVFVSPDISPEFDFWASLFTAGASMVNPFLVLRMDSRWKIRMPKLFGRSQRY
ncbi:hypothetical protein BKA69DRAFT_1087118 [Paraphysoderma sedebokerense]|nr:hypothetical protein BKA69DRAFT_1087118 [Paraphysoderma sedebokerense]